MSVLSRACRYEREVLSVATSKLLTKPAMILVAVLQSMLLALLFAPASVRASAVLPSTNDLNRANGWAHVNELSKGVGEVTLQFVSTRGFKSCFEYRTDGDTSQALPGANENTEIADLYPYVCVQNSTLQQVIKASSYVEVRLAFGAEKDERFDWTRFDVLPQPSIAAPTLIFPTNNDVINAEKTPLANDWSDVEGAVSYYYQSYNVDADGNCNLSDIRFTGEFAESHTNSRYIEHGVSFCWRVAAIDAAGNPSEWSDLWKVTIDNVAPQVTINDLTTDVASPELSGTIDDTTAVLAVVVNGVVYGPEIVVNGNTWILPAGVIADLAEGTYTVTVGAIDAAGNDSYQDGILTITVPSEDVPIEEENVTVDAPQVLTASVNLGTPAGTQRSITQQSQSEPQVASTSTVNDNSADTSRETTGELSTKDTNEKGGSSNWLWFVFAGAVALAVLLYLYRRFAYRVLKLIIQK